MPIPIHKLRLRVLPGVFAYARLEPGAAAPAWAENDTFSLHMRTRSESCVVCPDKNVPGGVKKEGPWKILGIDATLDFNQVGIIASLVVPLAEAGLSIAPIASFDTDYLLVREGDLERAKTTLIAAGHQFV
ncbi:MAG: ACT domain-containing protein [Phycisphaeraceae bacterium]|nr:ACT domain-containing protein [Phycisphaeraceae bacterium]